MTTKKKNNTAKKASKTAKNVQKTTEKATATVAAQSTAAVKEATNNNQFSALESKAVTPDHLMHAGTEAVKDFLSAGTQEAQKTQEKVLSFSQENIEKWTQSTDKTVRSFAEIFAVNKEQFDAVMESGKIAGDLSRDLHEQLLKEVNALFSENVELSKELLACRTLNDLVEVQNRAFQSSVSHFFEQSVRLTDTWFKLATDAAEPINTQATQATARLNKSLAA